MYVVYDEDLFLLKKQIEKIIKKTNWKNIMYETFSFAEDDLNIIQDHLFTKSLFFDKKIIVLKDAWFLTNQRKQTFYSNFDLVDLEKFLIRFNFYFPTIKSDTLIIFSLLTDKLTKNKVNEFIFNNSTIVKPLKHKRIEYEHFVKKIFEKHHQEIEQDLISLIVNELPNEFQILNIECQKLVNLNEPINKNLIHEILTDYPKSNIFNIGSALLKNDLESFLINYHNYFRDNQEFIPLIVFLTNNLITLRNYLLLKDIGENHQNILEKLNINPYFLKNLLRDNVSTVSQLNDKITTLYKLNKNLVSKKTDLQIIPEYEFIKFFKK